MDYNLTWFDKNIIPKTKDYKDFVNEIKNSSSENFFRDGEEFSRTKKIIL